MHSHHPWTQHEIARLRHHEHLRRAQASMRAFELGAEHTTEARNARSLTITWLGRVAAVLAVTVVAGAAAGTMAERTQARNDVPIERVRVEHGFFGPALRADDVETGGDGGSALWIE